MIDKPVSLFAKTPDEITRLLGLEKAFMGKQVYQWLVKGATSFDQMTNLSKMLRQKCSAIVPSIYLSQIIDVQTDDDGACKLALKLYDSCIVECVLLTDKAGELTACVSSQVGCAMGCKFCRTGTLHLTRNLFDFEIIEQYMLLQNHAGRKLDHIVFMGMGEPMANIDNVLKAIEFFHDPEGINFSHRRITISTCGVATGIRELASRGVPVKLAVSLVSADDEKRSSIMPVNRTFNLKTLHSALEDFYKVSGRRFTFEYCMIQGVNISDDDALKLARFCKGMEVIVNLIPFNPCPELDFKTPSKAEIDHFTSMLDSLKVEYTIRISRGRSIKGACGQLAGKLQNSQKK